MRPAEARPSRCPSTTSRATTGALKPSRCVPSPWYWFEGILIFADKTLRERMDVKIYVDADADLRFINGMVTSDKFCMSRGVTLQLSWRRGPAPRTTTP